MGYLKTDIYEADTKLAKTVDDEMTIARDNDYPGFSGLAVSYVEFKFEICAQIHMYSGIVLCCNPLIHKNTILHKEIAKISVKSWNEFAAKMMDEDFANSPVQSAPVSNLEVCTPNRDLSSNLDQIGKVLVDYVKFEKFVLWCAAH